MTNKSLSSIAEEYFYSINPLAQRIGQDVTATKEAYEGLWNALSTAEKNQAIDETIIQPEVALKYTLKSISKCSREAPDRYPKLRIQTGMRYVIDETGNTLRWRDEHSGPFSFMTQSQMNLDMSDESDEIWGTKMSGSDNPTESSLFASSTTEGSGVEISLDNYDSRSELLNFYRSDAYSNGVTKNSNAENLFDDCNGRDCTGNIFTRLMNKASLLKLGNSDACDDEDDEEEEEEDDREILVPRKNIACIRQAQNTGNSHRIHENINFNDSRSKSIDENESAALLETSSTYNSFQSLSANREDTIPKTGFEFLDNW